jgi:hypothetical protein
MDPSQEQTRAAYDALPQPVRAYLASTKLYDMVQGFAGSYSLHVDTSGAIATATTDLLLGLKTPAEFQAELIQMGVPSATVETILKELNEKMFKPLQDEIKNAPAEEKFVPEPEPIVPAPVTVPPALVTPVPSVPQQVAPVSPAPPPGVQPVPSAPPPPPVVQPPSPIVPAPPPQSPPAPRPVMPSVQQSSPPSWTRPPAPAPAPFILPKIPAVPSAPPLAPPAPTPAPPMTSVQNPVRESARRDELHNVLKKYGIDPYREAPE